MSLGSKLGLAAFALAFGLGLGACEKGTRAAPTPDQPGTVQPTLSCTITRAEEGCAASCEEPSGGFDLGCGKRFLYGINYAWLHFAGDFGGIDSWQQEGVVANAAEHAKNLGEMRCHDARLVRWWMFPDFRGDAVVFDGDDTPIGLGGTFFEDLEMALQLAEQADVYLMLTLFSFDGFRPTTSMSGRYVPSLQPIVLDPTKRTSLLENVVRPLAQAANASPYASRLLAWDIINEPEWALTGSDPYGGAPFYPNEEELEPITHGEMETFLAEAASILRAESAARITVGSAGLQWASAWSELDLDFYQVHRYDTRGYDFSATPESFGLDKPTMYGELPLEGFPNMPLAQAVEAWWQSGWAGVMPWQFDWAAEEDLDGIQAALGERACAIDLGH